MRNNKGKNYFYFMIQELELRKDFSGTIFYCWIYECISIIHSTCF